MNAAFKAMSDKTRRKILTLLKEKDMTAGEIAGHFDISKPSISHHLSILKNAQLIGDTKEGQTIVYSLNLTVLDEMMMWFMEMTGKTEKVEINEKG
jgi:DNA-binding transcriptional ArsR family regulator